MCENKRRGIKNNRHSARIVQLSQSSLKQKTRVKFFFRLDIEDNEQNM